MKAINFNSGWKWKRQDGGEWAETDLPHDAMISEQRTIDSDGGTNTGWFEGTTTNT